MAVKPLGSDGPPWAFDINLREDNTQRRVNSIQPVTKNKNNGIGSSPQFSAFAIQRTGLRGGGTSAKQKAAGAPPGR
jgi:hypothetical protein